MLFIGFADYRGPAQALARQLGLDYHEVEVHHFPDGESRLRLEGDIPTEVIVCRSLDRPNAKLVELMLLCRHLRAQGVQHITLVAPYLCYMRQDKAFHPGEVVSQPIIAAFISAQVDRLITVDPHLHRIAHLQQAYPDIASTTLTAEGVIVDYLKTLPRDLILLGPDGESEQWVSAIAAATGQEYAVAQKERFGDRQVTIQMPEKDFTGRRVMLIDDVVSTGQTLAQITGLLQQAGVKQVDCVVTHPLFSPGAQEALKGAGIHSIVSTDTILHDSNHLSLVGVIAGALQA